MNTLSAFENMKIKDLRKLTEEYLQLPSTLLQRASAEKPIEPSLSAEDIINNLNSQQGDTSTNKFDSKRQMNKVVDKIQFTTKPSLSPVGKEEELSK